MTSEHLITDDQLDLLYAYLQNEDDDDKLRLAVFEMLEKVRSTRKTRPASDMVSVFKDAECTHRFPSGFTK